MATAPQPLLDLNEVAAMMRISRRHAETLLATGVIPPPIRYGRIRRWHPDLIAEWLRDSAEQAATTSETRRGRPRAGE